MVRYIRSTLLLIGLVVTLGCAPSQPQGQAAAPHTTDTTPVKTEAGGKVREAAVASLFYPHNKEELAGTIEKCLAEAKKAPLGKLRGLVAPHAGYKYSGPTAGWAYKQLSGRDFDTAVVMAPSHYARFNGASIPDVRAYVTPLGKISLSPVADTLAEQKPFCRNPECDVRRPGWWRQSPEKLPPFGEDTPHTWEHSLEVQLPFLQATLKSFRLVPIVFGKVDPEKVAEGLETVLNDQTLLVASSDLSHYEPYDVAKRLDASCVRAICDLDAKLLSSEEACGKGPILTLIHLAKKKGWKAKLLDYRNSGDTAGDRSGVVGYAAIAFYEPGKDEAAEEPSTEKLTEADKKFLMDLARKTVNSMVRDKKVPDVKPADVPRRLREDGATFVTLTRNGRLRGCLGQLVASEPLYKSVLDNARKTTFADSRFLPVEKQELDQIEVEVSVLTTPKRLEYDSPEELLKKLRPHVDGVILRVGDRRATYLPQVWEQIPEPQVFLEHLSKKAGLEASAWKSPEAMILTYQVEAFKESEL